MTSGDWAKVFTFRSAWRGYVESRAWAQRSFLWAPRSRYLEDLQGVVDRSAEWPNSEQAQSINQVLLVIPSRYRAAS